MPAPNPAHAVVVTSGNVYVAPVNTAPPTGLEAPAAPWENLGFLTEEGPRLTGFSRSTTKFYAWNTDSPIRSKLDNAEPQVEMDLMQVEQETLALYFGGGAFAAGTAGDAADPAIQALPAAYAAAERAVVIDWVDGDVDYRFVMSRASVVANGDMTLGRGEMMQLPVRAEMLAPVAGGSPADFRFEARA